MEKPCKNCGKKFGITSTDQDFYKKINVPEPTFCPDCRQQRRLAFRNERNLYKRKCDLTGKEMIAIYSPENPYKVYDQTDWWSDKWDPLSYGRDFDFSRPFFDQFSDLLKVVGHPSVGYRFHNENCDYTTFQNHSKNCYLCFGSGYMEDCAYTNWTYYAKNSLDCLGASNIELCYELTDCKKMYGSTYCQDCSNLTDSHYCYDCHSCQDCFGCVGLRQKKFCFLNQQLSENEYREKIRQVNLPQFLADFEALKLKTPRRAIFQLSCEDCSGDHLSKCKNVTDSFYTDDSRDCKFNTDCLQNTDTYDTTRTGELQVSYECIGGGFYYDDKFFIAGEESSNCSYCFHCYTSKKLFGCVSLKRKEFCILNKQYNQAEYEDLVPRIIEHMKKPGPNGEPAEWGEFFPVKISPFAYNETLANEYYPMTKEQVLASGLRWKEKDHRDYLPQTYQVPAKISDIKDDIIAQILACKECGKNYKIIPQELSFYRKMGLPIPFKCPDCRHKIRMSLRNPRQLFDRTCAKCGTTIKTTFSTKRPEIVYCEKCYLAQVY